MVRALQQATNSGCVTIALIGDRGCLLELVDITISVPSTQTRYVQECPLSIEHILCEMVELMLFQNAADGPGIRPALPSEDSNTTLERVCPVETK